MIVSEEVNEVAALSSEQPEPMIPRLVQDALGERLRAMYDIIKAEPVPDHFCALLQRIDQRPSKE